MLDGGNARLKDQLGLLRQYFDEAGLEAHWVEPSQDIPIPVVLLPLMKDHRQRDRFLHFSFVPLDEEDLEAIDLLQIYTTVPVEWAEGTREQVEKLLPAINGSLAIGHFNVTGDEVTYRYVYSVPANRELQSAEALSVIRLFEMMLNMFSEAVDDVASGRSGYAQVMSEISS